MKGTAKKAETLIGLSLKDSELRYRRLFEAAQDGILILDASTEMIEDVNPYLIKMLGYSRKELMKKKLWEVGAFKDIEVKWTVFEALQENETIRYEDLQLKTKDGRLIQVEFVSNVYLVGDEKVIQCNIRDSTARKRMDKALSESEELFSKAFNFSPMALTLAQVKDGVLVDANRAFEHITGYSQAEAIGKSADELNLYPDPLERERAVKLLQHEGRLTGLEIHLRHKSGELRHIQVSSELINVGESSYILSISEDITARKRAEEALHESEKRFRALIENSSDAITLLDAKGIALYDSPAAPGMLGYAPEDWIGQDVFVLIHPDDLPKIQDLFQNLIETPGAHVKTTFRLRHKSGSWLWIEAVGTNLLAEPGVKAIVLNYRDITQRKRAEDALLESEAKFRRLVEHLPTVVYTNALGDASSTLYVSPQIKTLLGYTPEEWLTDPKMWLKAVHPEDRQHVLAQAETADQSHEPFDMEYRMIARDGHLVWVHDQVILVNDLEGQHQFRQGVMLDITERKRAEEALRASKLIIEEIINAIPVRVFWKDKNLVYLGCNAVFARDAGFSDPKDVIGKNDYQTGWHDQAELYRGDDRQVIESGSSKLLVEEPQTTPEGNIITLLTSKVPLRSSKGEVIGVLGTYMDITERKQSEEALHRNEHNLAEAQRIAHIGSHEYDVRSDQLYWSDEVLNIFGIAPEEFHGTEEDFIKRIHPDDRERVIQTIEQAITQHVPGDFEHRIVRPDGTVRIVHERFEAVYDDQGERVRHIGTIQDITERKHVEDTLRESEERFRMLIEQASDGIFISDVEGRFTEVNSAGCRMLGYTREEILQKTIRDLTKIVRAQPLQLDELRLGKTILREREMIRRDGSLVSVEINARQLPDGSVQDIVRDITKRRQAEEALRENEKRYRLLLDTSLDAILLTAPDGSIISANSSACRIFERTEEEIIQVGRSGVVDTSDPRLAMALEERKRTGKFVGELTFVRKDGTKFPGELSSALFKDKDGLVRTSMIIRDITERKQAEEALSESRAQLAGIIASAMDAIITVGAEKRIIGFNAAAEKMFGYPAANAIGLPLALLLPERFREVHREQFAGFGEDGRTTRRMENLPALTGRRANGEEFPLEISISYTEVNGKRLYTAIARDITERKRAEEEIKKQIDELQRWHNAMLGRETRVLDLKREVNELLNQIGQPSRYPSAESQDKEEK